MVKLSVVFVGCYFLLMGTGCNGFFVNPTLTGVSINPQNPTLQASGQSVQLQAIGTYNDGSTKTVTGSCTWTSSDTTVVTVNSSGLVTAATSSQETATVTADCTTSSGDATGDVNITIGQAAQGLVINSSLGNNISLTTDPAGTEIDFSATLNGADVTSQTAFTSSDPSIISLSGNLGSITGGQGSVTITGTEGGATGSVTITVGP